MEAGTFFATLQAYIDAIPEDEKASGAVYEARLAKCKACHHLLDGMCVLCGCYVELRAAKVLQRCVLGDGTW